MPMNWDNEAQQKLLLFVLASNPNQKINFDTAAAYFTTDTVTCTARAVQEQMKKLQKIVKNDGAFKSAIAGNGEGTNSAASTPAAKSKGTPKKSNKKVKDEPVSDENDDEKAAEPPVPTKKRKVAASKTKKTTPVPKPQSDSGSVDEELLALAGDDSPSDTEV